MMNVYEMHETSDAVSIITCSSQAMGFAGYFTMEMLNLCTTHYQYKGDLSFSTDAYQPTRIHPRLEAQVGPDTRQIDHSDHLS